ncbi:dienelactone hydrolase family protein [Rhodobacteraceae bacterium D3-12]|nr:dienelactone hydrolase family protein [Rhodobacteraceae bacterium D3-12]
MIITKDIIYTSAHATHHGTISHASNQSGPRPIVLVLPAFGGKGAFDIAVAERLAALGYVGFAVDVYGDGRQAASPEEASALMGEMTADRGAMLRRLLAAVDCAGAQEVGDAGRMAALGFCFGGKCVLDLARANAPLRGVISFHGVYDAPPEAAAGAIAPSVLVLHGWDDPLATPDDLTTLAEELSAREADWQVLGFGATGHAFTNPKAQNPEGGMFYEPRSERRAWQAAERFLEEVLE